MTLRETLHYDASPEQVYAMLIDHDFQSRVMSATLAIDHQVDISTATDPVVETRRTLPTDQAPEVIRRMIGGTVAVTQRTRWAAAEPDGSRTAHTDLAIEGVPVTVTGDIRLSPSAGGTDQVVTADVRSKIPLVGGKIAAAATPLIASALHAEHRTGQVWLEQH